jgi:hypothetical protein
MARANISRPGSLPALMAEATRLGLQFEIPPDTSSWPLWPADHPYRRFSCDKKAPFLYVEGALSEAITVMRTKGLRLRVYPCGLALHYHVTKRPVWEEWPVDGPPLIAGADPS